MLLSKLVGYFYLFLKFSIVCNRYLQKIRLLQLKQCQFLST